MAIEKKFVREQINRLLIAEFLKDETERAGFGGIDIQRTPMGTRVSLIAERPGMIIGRRGSNISRLTADLAQNFNAENPQIEVVEAGRDANLNAQIMARKVAEALERGWHFRRAGHSTVRRIMESGAKGCIVILSGKLTGQRHRVEKFIQGHIKYNGDTALQLMDVGYSQCKKKLGTIGCTVKIMHPDARLPDEVDIFAPGEKAAKAEAARRPPRREEPKPEAKPEEGAAKPEAPAAPAEERTERRSRRREPTPQLTEADIAEAKAHHAKKEAEKQAAKAGPETTKVTPPAEPAAEPEPTPAAEPELQPEATPEASPAPTPEAKPQGKPGPKADTTPEPKPEATPEAKPEKKAEPAKSETPKKDAPAAAEAEKPAEEKASDSTEKKEDESS